MNRDRLDEMRETEAKEKQEQERLGKTCNNFDMLLAEIKQLLAKEFPATGGAN